MYCVEKKEEKKPENREKLERIIKCRRNKHVDLDKMSFAAGSRCAACCLQFLLYGLHTHRHYCKGNNSSNSAHAPVNSPLSARIAAAQSTKNDNKGVSGVGHLPPAALSRHADNVSPVRGAH